MYSPKRYVLKRPKSNKPRKCIDCKEILTKENWYRNNGNTHSRCLPCRNIYFRKQSTKRKEIMKNNKLW